MADPAGAGANCGSRQLNSADRPVNPPLRCGRVVAAIGTGLSVPFKASSGAGTVSKPFGLAPFGFNWRITATVASAAFAAAICWAPIALAAALFVSALSLIPRMINAPAVPEKCAAVATPEPSVSTAAASL